MLTLHSAPTVLTMTGPPIEDGAVIVEEDRVTAVGTRRAMLAAEPKARERAWSGVLMPGLVNAHAHLQYTDFEELNAIDEPFHVWIASLVAKRASFTDARWQESARRGLHLMLKSGTTSVADVVTDPAVLLPTARSGMGGISYIEAVFQDADSWAQLGRDRLINTLESDYSGRALGISPHTPYTLSTGVFEDCVGIARRRGLRTHTHLAESPAEVEYVRHGTGPFADSMKAAARDMELIRDGGCGQSPTGYLEDIGVLGPDVHAAHCVHCDAADRKTLRTRRVFVALCVRSNRILQAGEPPIADYLHERAPFAVGTDSLASSPSLDLLEEAAALRDLARTQGYPLPDLDRRIIGAATVGGAAAMGLRDIGRIEPGARADFAVFDVNGRIPAATGEVYTELLDAAAAGQHRCRATVLGGIIVHRA
jgi:aminodeoxyfutalosine deaminase